MSTKSGRKIGGVYRYYPKARRLAMFCFTAPYLFFLFMFLSSGGKSLAPSLILLQTVAVIFILLFLVVDARGVDERAFHRYRIHRESIDDRGNSKILVEWLKDGRQEWIPNTPVFTERYRIITE